MENRIVYFKILQIKRNFKDSPYQWIREHDKYIGPISYMRDASHLTIKPQKGHFKL